MASSTLSKGALWMQNVDFPATWDRALIDAIYPSEGVIDGFAVTPNGGLGIAIGPGRAVIQGDEVANQGKYLVDQDSVVSMTLASVGANRTEYVYIAVNDTAVAGGRAGNNVTIETSTTPPPGSALLIATLTLTTGTATITTGMIADSRSLTDVVVAGSITTGKLADNAVTSAKIADGEVNTADLANGAVSTSKIADNAITASKIAADSVTTARIVDGAVTIDKLSAGIVALLDVLDPADLIIAVAGPTAPPGFSLCDGAPVSRSAYPETFARIGIAYGPGDGSTTFNKPDLRSRFIAGKGAAAWSDALGKTGGSKDAVPVAHSHTTPNHNHTIDHNHAPFSSDIESTPHTHGSDLGFNILTVAGAGPFGPYSVAGGGFYNFWANDVGLGTETANHTHLIDVPAFTGSSGNAAPSTNSQTPTADGVDDNLPPYITLNYCIRLR
jgi:microcystin-dependent protein